MAETSVTPDPPASTLILLRHAKSAWPPNVSDVHRPLAPRGRQDAPAAGRWLRREAPPIDFVLCSPALRAQQTWELVGPHLDPLPPIRYDERIYGGWAEVLFQLIREHLTQTGPPETSTVLLVGHNPGLEEMLWLLTGATEILKTSAIAVLTTALTWGEAHPGSWTLDHLALPRG